MPFMLVAGVTVDLKYLAYIILSSSSDFESLEQHGKQQQQQHGMHAQFL